MEPLAEAVAEPATPGAAIEASGEAAGALVGLGELAGLGEDDSMEFAAWAAQLIAQPPVQTVAEQAVPEALPPAIVSLDSTHPSEMPAALPAAPAELQQPPVHVAAPKAAAQPAAVEQPELEAEEPLETQKLDLSEEK